MAARKEDKPVAADAGRELRGEPASARTGQTYEVRGSVMGIVDTTLTDVVHVTGHVASEVVNTAAGVIRGNR